MADEEYKKFTVRARRGIKGEAFFESLIVSHAIPHRIARQNDLGIDFICEWIHKDNPTGIIFLAQVKTTTNLQITPQHLRQSRLNKLEEYVLPGISRISKRTIKYWKGLRLPAFLFVIVESASDSGGGPSCYYKRYTPLLDGHASREDRNGSTSFHLVNHHDNFFAFADNVNEVGGFARDLIIDFARVAYSNGHVIQLTPRQLGFWPFPDKGNPDAVRYFADLLRWNRKKILETCRWTSEILKRLPLD